MAFKIKINLNLHLLLLFLITALCLALASKDPELKQCKHQCKVQRQFDEQQKRDCERSCDEYYKMKKEKGRNYESEEEEEEEEEEENPYVFDDEHFVGKVETGEGKIKVLQKFTQRSQLLRGIENFRVSIVEANPSTFVVPTHFDAEIIMFVAQGNAVFILSLFNFLKKMFRWNYYWFLEQLIKKLISK